MPEPTVCVVMQPTYLPWIGYFDLIDQSDEFVFLDSVQFDKRSWQQRNRIRTSKGLEWLTVPVRVKGRYHQLIRDVEITGGKFPQSHIRAVELSYRRSPCFERFFPRLAHILCSAGTSLCELNISLIRWLAEAVGVGTRFASSHSLGAQGKRNALLTDICKRVHAHVYLSPAGSREYLEGEVEHFAREGITILLHQYEHPRYAQLYSPFIPFASVIDLLFNEGDRALDVIRSGRRRPLVLSPKTEGESHAGD